MHHCYGCLYSLIVGTSRLSKTGLGMLLEYSILVTAIDGQNIIIYLYL